ncbi:MAG TPA: glycosyltransferase, partial [Acidimicrobiales bacterium]|nr:glycosyltransferase [Acidimicrobiales bacterium]
RVRLLRSPGSGIVGALNAGCAAAAGRYIARMDADDVAVSSRLELQLALLEGRSEVGIVGGQMQCADGRGRVRWRAVYPTDDAGIRAMTARANPFAHPTVVFRTELFRLTGGFRSVCREAEDFDLWCRMLDHAEGANLDEVLVQYRVHAGQSTLKRAYQQTLSSLAVRAAHPIRVGTGEDPLAKYDLVTEEVVFELGVDPAEVRRALVESAIVVAGHTRRLGEWRRARRMIEDAAALCSSGTVPEGWAPQLWRLLAREAARTGQPQLALTAAARARGIEDPAALLASQATEAGRALASGARSAVGTSRAWARALALARGRFAPGARNSGVGGRGARNSSGSGVPNSGVPNSGNADVADASAGDAELLEAPGVTDPRWRPDLELSIWSWHAGELDAGFRACERLLSDPELPAAVASVVSSNQTWYAPLLAEWIDGVGFAELKTAVREGWSAFNPSLAAGPGGLRAIVRSANYTLREDRAYDVLDPDGVIRSENYVVTLDDDLTVLETRTLRELDGRDRLVSGFPVRGYEDCRLFSAGDRWHALATVRDRSEEGRCRIALLDLERTSVVRETLLEGPDPARHEKNWVPFSYGDETRLVYSFEPTVVLSLDLASGSVRELSRAPGTGLPEQVRGGTPGVRIGNGWIFLVHECVWMPGGRRRYPHRFVILGDDLTVKVVSRPFFFLDRTIEFAAGMAADGEDLVVSFGVGDASAWCARLPLGALLEALHRDVLPGALTRGGCAVAQPAAAHAGAADARADGSAGDPG